MGRVSVVLPRISDVSHVDATWPPLRPSDHQNTHWRWEKILRTRPERLAIVNEEHHVIALWCSGKYRPLRLPEGPHYRLDYVEIHPSMRGGELGVFAFSMVAARALELGCDGMVLESLPGTTQFYTNLGGEQRVASGWKTKRGLVPFVFSGELLARLKEEADELIIEE